MKIITILLALISLSSCAVSRLPDSLSVNQKALINSLKYRCTIAVEKYDLPIYSEKLMSSLKKTNMFDRVIYDYDKCDSELIARVTYRVSGEPTIPIIAIITLGIIPTVTKETHGLRFELIRRDDRASKEINATYSGSTWLGWITFFMMPLPAYSGRDPLDTERYNYFLKYKLFTEASEIIYKYKITLTNH